MQKNVLFAATLNYKAIILLMIKEFKSPTVYFTLHLYLSRLYKLIIMQYCILTFQQVGILVIFNLAFLFLIFSFFFLISEAIIILNVRHWIYLLVIFSFFRYLNIRIANTMLQRYLNKRYTKILFILKRCKWIFTTRVFWFLIAFEFICWLPDWNLGFFY